MKDLYRLLSELKKNPGEAFALATVIRVEGSAYRRASAKMLFAGDGRRYGTISAGCLEDDLFHHAGEVMGSGHPKFVTYDMRAIDDLSWGQGKGCNGTITVYVEPIQWETPNLQSIYGRLHSGEAVVVCKVIGENVGEGRLWLFKANGEPIIESMYQPFEVALTPYLERFVECCGVFDRVTTSEGEVVFERYEPKDPLYIFGAGPDAEPLAQLASQYDFSITLVDPRSERNGKHLFPAADHFVVEHPESFLSRFDIPKHSFVIIMTHSFSRDRTILTHLMKSPPRYTGVLGPRKRTERMLEQETVPDWVHSPIGLPIHADGPEEISISIMAELIQCRNKRRNVHERVDKACSGERIR